MKKIHLITILVIAILFNIIFSSVSFAWSPKSLRDFGVNVSFAQSNPQVFGPPETLEGVKNVGMKTLKIFPTVFKGLWQEALGAWKGIFQKIKNFWIKYINPWFQSLLKRIEKSFKKEAKRRKPIIEEEFKKEQKEMKKEAPDVGKSLWERFRELLK